MIEKIIKLRGIGLLHEPLPSGALEMKPIVMIYAENGRGKSTFASICHSLSTGDAILIEDKETIGGSLEPEVHFRVHNESYEFRNGKWSGSCSDILVFDDRFVETNVCIGSRVEASHRENLLEFAIGEQGVRLKEEIASINQRIEDINHDLRVLIQLISQHKGPFTLDQFVQLQPVQDVNMKIQETHRKLQEAENIDAIRRRPAPEPVNLPELDLSRLEQLLAGSLETVADDAEQRIKDHIEHHLDANGETWLRQGLSYLERTTGCPFCGQNVQGLELVEAYKQYFNAAYDDFKRQIEEDLREVEERFGYSAWASIKARLELNKSAENSWADMPDLKFPANLEMSTLKSVFTLLHDTLIAAINQKLSAPLSKIRVPDTLHQANEQYAAVRSQVNKYNQDIERVCLTIEYLKNSLGAVNTKELRDSITRLQAEKERTKPEVAKLCQRYQDLRIEKSKHGDSKIQKRAELNTFTNTQLQQYKDEINKVLSSFGAGFTIAAIEVAHIRGTPRTEYGLQVMGEDISVSSQSGRSFSNTLSSGDKKTLALAFFLARLRLDPQLNRRIVIIDDPVSSLDTGRRRATRNVLVELAKQCAQLIVLSHDATFLKDILERVDQNNCYTLRMRRHGEYSIIEDCDIYRICRDEYYRIYESLIHYLQEGPENNESKIAEDIRKYLEHNLRNRFPIELEGARNLGKMICRIQDSPERFGQFTVHLDDLNRLNDFTSPYHHMASDRPPPPTDAELRPMVELTLEIGRGL